MPSDATPSRARTALSVALLALIYLWVFPYHAAVGNPNENARIYMTVAVVDDHTFAIDRVERDWGYTNDKAAYGGHVYSGKAPGTSYLGIPGYWLLTKITGRNSIPLTPAQIAAHHKPPLDRHLIVYVIRLTACVLPALLFAWFWHRFLGRYTRVPALREAAFFSTMVGSQMFAYSEMFASHAHNAYATMGALMALAYARERDAAARAGLAPPRASLGLFAVAGLLGAGATMFEYPVAIASGVVALLILASASRAPAGTSAQSAAAAAARDARDALFRPVGGTRGALLIATGGLLAMAMGLALRGHKKVALALFLVGALNYAATLSRRAIARLAAAGVGAIPPVFLTLLYHKRCFGDAFTPGARYAENPQFHAEHSQGFFGATQFSWEAAVRMWFDPSFGLVPGTPILLAALLGLGAGMAWRPPWPRATTGAARALAGALAGVAMVLAVRAVVATARAGHFSPGVASYAWIAYAAVAIVLFASLALPRPPRGDAALFASIGLICFGMTRLISMMNNWRGGWQVGPRYLGTLVPLAGFLALVGLDALAAGSVARRRAVTVFAAGGTLVALVTSGLPSAYFPHVPTEFVSPTFELFVPLVRDGFVPHNAGRYLLHWEGLKSMAPFFVAVALAMLAVLRGGERRPAAVTAHALGALAVACVLLAPLAAAAKYDATAGSARFVRTVWEPRPANTSSAAARGAPPAAESAEAARTRGRRLAESGESAAAFEAFRRAAAQARR